MHQRLPWIGLHPYIKATKASITSPRSPSLSVQLLPSSSFPSMARLLLISLLLLHLMAASLVTVRPVPVALQLTRPPRDANPPSLSVSGELGLAGAPQGMLGHRKRHRPFDKSIAGAEVILGGLAAAIFVAIFAYIRVTRKRSSESKV